MHRGCVGARPDPHSPDFRAPSACTPRADASFASVGDVSNSVSDDYRFYQRRHAPRILRATMYPAVVIFGAVFVLGQSHDTGSFPVAVAVIYVLVVVVVVAWCERVVVDTGLQECEEGFVNRSNFGAKTLRLDDIERFESRKLGAVRRVVAVHRDGSAAVIQGLAQGWPIVWQGGVSRAIVEILNDRLLVLRAKASAHAT